MRNSRLAIAGFSALLVVWIVYFTTNHFRQFGSIAGHTTPTTERPSALVRSLRPSYPYSVISGGAYSPTELRFANDKDSVVRAHYADFDLSHARVVRLSDDRFQYVSYRLNNQVYWTKKKLKIPSGELLLTDGAQYCRARCGNRLSDMPHKAAISSQEPESALLTLPPVNLDLLPKLALADPPELGGMPATLSALPRQDLPKSVDALAPIGAWPAQEQPLVPLIPVWGGQPLTSSSPGSLLASNGSPSLLGSTTNPLGTPGAPKTPVVPGPALVPEPSTVYLFLVTLLVAGAALIRMGIQDGPAESKSKRGTN